MKISKTAILLAFVFCTVAGSAQAATDLYWSANGSTLGGSGTWDTSAGQWSSSGSAPFSTVWDNGNNDTAIFGGTAGTVTNSGVTVGGLTFAAANYTLTGSTLTFGTAGIITNAGAATISCTIAGSGTITKNGAGALTLLGVNTYTGDTMINAGSVTVGSNGSAATLGLSPTYAGNIFIASGTLLLNNNTSQNFSGIISGGGALHKAGSGTLTLSGNNTYTGKTSVYATGAGGPTLSVSSFNSVSNNVELGTVHSAYSSLGAPTTVANGTIDLGSGSNTRSCTLIYAGPGETTDRIIT